MLVKQLDQSNEIDVVVPSLFAFLLGVCYEFNHEAGEVTRCVSHLPRSSTDGLNIDIVRTSQGEDALRTYEIGCGCTRGSDGSDARR